MEALPKTGAGAHVIVNPYRAEKINSDPENIEKLSITIWQDQTTTSFKPSFDLVKYALETSKICRYLSIEIDEMAFEGKSFAELVKLVPESKTITTFKLSLNQADLKEKGVQEIGELVKKLPNLAAVELQINEMGMSTKKDSVALGKAFSGIKTLVSANIIYNRTAGGTEFFGALDFSSSRLETLKLDLSYSDVTDAKLLPFFKGVEPKALKELGLNLTETQIQGKALTKIADFTSLESLDLNLSSCQSLVDDGALALGENLQNLSNLSTIRFSFTGTSLSPKPYGAIFATLAKAHPQGKVRSLVLDLQWAQIDNDAALSLAAFLENQQNLIELTLNINGTQISSKSYVKTLLSASKATGLRALELNLESCSVATQDLAEITELLGSFSKLRSLSLDLKGTEFDDNHADILFKNVIKYEQLAAFTVSFDGTLVTEQKLEYYNEKLMKELKDPNIDIKINY